MRAEQRFRREEFKSSLATLAISCFDVFWRAVEKYHWTKYFTKTDILLEGPIYNLRVQSEGGVMYGKLKQTMDLLLLNNRVYLLCQQTSEIKGDFSSAEFLLIFISKYL